MPFLLPLMFQLSFGYSAEVSGWLLAPIALMSVVFKRFIGHILNILGYKTTLILSSLLMAGSTVSMSWLDSSSSTTWIICNFDVVRCLHVDDFLVQLIHLLLAIYHRNKVVQVQPC